MTECATKMAKPYKHATSKKVDTCLCCGKPFEVLRSYKYLEPHICPKCRKLSSVKWEAKYAPPAGSSVQDAWANFFLAIKKKAEEDGELKSWREYWVTSNTLKKIWLMLQEEAARKTGSRPVASHDNSEYN
jgi:hypothetical protein